MSHNHEPSALGSARAEAAITTAKTRPASDPVIITIDLDAVAANWRALAGLAGLAECAAVVKADAYGLGAARVVPVLAAAGCRTFFVATLDEALAVRRLIPAHRIYVLDGLLPGQAGAMLEANVEPVLGTLEEVREWAAVCRTIQRRGPAALNIDTGMNRTGLEPPEIDAMMAEPGLIDAFEPTLVMSHLACADDPAARLNGRQREAFEGLIRRFSGVRGSLVASAGLLLGRDWMHDLVRPGYALYGGQPSGIARLPMTLPVVPAVTIEARVIGVRDVERGESVGYGAAWTAARRSQIATIAIGYADGYPRSASNAVRETPGRATDDLSAYAAFCGKRLPLAGHVSMDLVTLDVTDLADKAPKRGDLVELIGPNVPLEEVARAAGTIGYELLTSLSRRAQRIYCGGSQKGERDGQS